MSKNVENYRIFLCFGAVDDIIIIQIQIFGMVCKGISRGKNMKIWRRFNLIKRLKKHFLFIAFSILVLIYLSYLLFVREFLELNISSNTVYEVLVTTVKTYFIVASFYFTTYLYKLLPKEKYWIITAIRIVCLLLLIYCLYKYLAVYHLIFNQISESFSYLQSIILDKFDPKAGGRRNIINPAFFEMLFTIAILFLFVSLIWNFSLEIRPITIQVSKTTSYFSFHSFYSNTSLGFLYKALP